MVVVMAVGGAARSLVLRRWSEGRRKAWRGILLVVVVVVESKSGGGDMRFRLWWVVCCFRRGVTA